MLRSRLPIAVLLLLIPLTAAAQSDSAADPEALASLFQNMVGEWQCTGSASKGLSTASNISITAEHGGQVLVYSHVGLEGHTNRSVSIWSFDKPNQGLVVARQFVTTDGNFADVFAGEQWTENTLVLEARELWAPLWSENRFLYDLSRPGVMEIRWEIKKDDWELGDEKVCRRQ